MRSQTLLIYSNVCRGLFEKDKPMFSFMICTDILKDAGSIAEVEWSLFLRGAAGVVSKEQRLPSIPTLSAKSLQLAVACQVWTGD